MGKATHRRDSERMSAYFWMAWWGGSVKGLGAPPVNAEAGYRWALHFLHECLHRGILLLTLLRRTRCADQVLHLA